MSADGGSVAAIVVALREAHLLVSAPEGGPARVRSISDDSRHITADGLFVAVRGTAVDGHRFISAARAAGACLVLAEDATEAAGGPAIIVRDGRRAAALAAAAFYENPASSLRLIAVTGTNGKTTTVDMLRHLLDGSGASGSRAASIGTLGVRIGSAGAAVEGGAGLTTPGPVELQRVLRLLVEHDAGTVAMEVSSHALAQHRVEGVAFDAAVFTNVTRDHLDYHGTMEAYLAAKLSLAGYIAPGGTAIVGIDDPAWKALPPVGTRVTFGLSTDADVRADEVRYSPTGVHFRLDAGAVAPVHLPLIGDFNVVNALGAAAAAIALGMSVPAVAARLDTMPQVPGRLERIGQSPAVLRDYSHTPDSLERALRALRPFVGGRLIVVFGAGGDRDPGKRPQMGAAAARHADVVIVTSDNPRTEDPEAIIDAIVAGIPNGACERIEDRRAAITRAIEIADPARDLVLLAGKGHETYQVRGTTRVPFDEAKVVGEILAARRSRTGGTAPRGGNPPRGAGAA